MKNQVTFGHVLTVLAIIVLPLLLWGINVEKRLEKVINNSEEIKLLKTELKDSKKSNQDNFDEVLEKLHNIELVLKDKKDRE